MTNTRLWLIRHGEPAPEVRGRCYGRLDIGLSEEGRRQAERAAERLRGEPFAAIYSSPRRRALESAEILAGPHACGVSCEEDLREIDFGDLEGLTYDEIAARHPELYRRWMERPTEVEFPNGESFPALRLRVRSAMAALLNRHAGECVALVTHGGVIRVVLAEALGMPPANLFCIAQRYGALNLIHYLGSQPVIELINGAA